MTRRQHTKIVREGNYLAEVSIELIEYGEEKTPETAGWAPYLSLEDAMKLDSVREALRSEDIKTALQNARVFALRQVAV